MTSYCTNLDIEAALGLEAGTLTTEQDTMIDLMITLIQDLIDMFAGESYSTVPRGIRAVTVAGVVHLYRNGIEQIFNTQFVEKLENMVKLARGQSDPDGNVYLMDMVDPFDEDVDT